MRNEIDKLERKCYDIFSDPEIRIHMAYYPVIDGINVKIKDTSRDNAYVGLSIYNCTNASGFDSERVISVTKEYIQLLIVERSELYRTISNVKAY